MTPERPVAFARALTLVRPVSRRRLYWTARGVFVSDQAQIPAFDRVFFSVFGRRGDGQSRDDRPDVPREAHTNVPLSVRSVPEGDDESERRGRRPAGRGQRRGAARDQELRRARTPRARAAVQAHVAARAGHAAAAHAPLRARPPRAADRPAPHAASQPAHGRPADPPGPPAPPRGAPPAGGAVRHLGLDGALRAGLPAVRGRRGRQRAQRGGVRLRHPPHAPDPGAGLAPPRTRDPARRRRGAGLVERHADRRLRSRPSTTVTAAAGWRAGRWW